MRPLLMVLPIRSLACIAFQPPLFASQYKIEHCYEPFNQCRHNEDEMPLHRFLPEIDPDLFPSRSQARKAIRYGRLLVLRADDYRLKESAKDQSADFDAKTILDLGVVANTTTMLQDKDIVAIRSREPNNDFYPQSCTKYVDPPSNAVDLMSTKNNAIVFESDHFAIVNKPEGLDTIGEKRQDLQSVLPFMLHPPTATPSKSQKNKKTVPSSCYLPRPVHRLDRRTSGCVLVAKSEYAMKQFSRLFATRQIQKSYCAITFNAPAPVEHGSGENDDRIINVDGKTFSVIDYPIDGKDAVTLWRVVVTVTSPTWGEVSLLHLLPKTGRNHQIRRHLSYCLSCPIVGDSKYDGGGTLAKAAREELGMFLCSNSMEFECVAHNNEMMMEDKSDVSVSANIQLPDKFYELLGCDRDDILI